MENQPINPDIVLSETRTPAAQVTSPAPRPAWCELAQADPEGLVFQYPAWTDALCAGGAYQDASRLYEFTDGTRLLLPLVRRAGLSGLVASQASMPASWGMGGLLSNRPLTSRHVAAVFADLRSRPVLRTTIRINPVLQKVWNSAKPDGVGTRPMHAHVLDLRGGFDEVWSKRFASETRTAVRKAEKSGLTVECDTTGRLIPAFYDLFRLSVDRWSEQQHEPRRLGQWRAARRDSLQKFQAMAHALGDSFRLWVAWKDGQPAAAILVLQGKNASYTRGAMNKDLAGPTRANQLLHRLAIESACNAGCRRYHMGESGSSSSLAQFKSRFGAEPVDYAEYILEKVPLTALDRHIRGTVKKMIGFQDAR